MVHYKGRKHNFDAHSHKCYWPANGTKAMQIITSPSQLILNDDCSLANHFKYTRRLYVPSLKRWPSLASGTAVSYVAEHLLGEGGKATPPGQSDVEALARECLEDEFKSDDDGGAANLKKFLPGVIRAVKRIPEWVWQAEWHVEEEVVGHFPVDDLEVVLKCRPDIFRLFTDQEGVEVLEIVDFKTTDYNPLDFMLWSPQIRMYAATLKQHYPTRLIQYRYLCLPTTPSDKSAPWSPPFIFTAATHDKTVKDILRLARKLRLAPEPRYSRRCSFCDFQGVCTTSVTGGDPESYIASELKVRPTSEEIEAKKWELQD